jgi:CheY-like chemotaxis protein/Tfp pilus assembly protein PilZ
VIRPILVVSREDEFLRGMSTTLVKFGYSTRTSPVEEDALLQAAAAQTDAVVLDPPRDPGERKICLDAVRAIFLNNGVQVLVCSPTPEEGDDVQTRVRGAQVIVGAPLRLNDLYIRIQRMFDLVHRRELRISADLAVAHRLSSEEAPDRLAYDLIISLSPGGCFIRSPNPYPVGTAIQTDFCLGGASYRVQVTGHVCHHGHGRPGSPPGGMGIQFESMGYSDRALIEAFVIEQLGAPAFPATL